MSRKSDLYLLSEQYAKVYEGTDTIEPEGDASAVNWDADGVLEVQPDGQYPEPPKQEVDAEDMGEEMDPMDDPMFQQALDILERLKERSPDKFEKFITRLMDITPVHDKEANPL